jgi:tRNA A-37 threonylcarbamoyl transferase component Bud32
VRAFIEDGSLPDREARYDRKPMIGTIQEGRYRVLRKIGEGAQGEVYLAEHIHLGRTEALKVLKEKLARDENFVSRFRREARATNRVQHPNIVAVYDFGRLDSGRYFLAMEYVDGERLDHAIGGAPMPVQRALRIAAQLARGLAHAHAMEVVHRDLKPANIILITNRGHADFVKILDFGMAKILDSALPDSLGSSLDGQMFGTAPYMAPEQFLERHADPRMDVYATGCILLEMLTGRPPFHGGMAMQMEQHMRKAPDTPSHRQRASGITPEVDALVLRCLEKRPDDRFADAGVLADAIDALIAPAPAVRRTKLGVAIPVADDFEEETERGETDPGVGAAVLEQMSSQRAAETAAELVEELADTLVDLGVADAGVLAGAAQLRDLRRRIARMRGEAAEIDARAHAHEQSTREREASLTFALGELSFDRDQGGADVAVQIEGLARSLAALGAESRLQATALDDQALGVASALHDAEESYATEARRVLPGVSGLLDRVADAAPLRRRLATARSLLGDGAGP